MAKNINVTAHAKRYDNTELSDVVALIAELTKMVDSRRQETIDHYERKLAVLKSGEIPSEQAEKKPARTRGGKKVATDEQD